jgi:competence protein ComEC
MSLGGSLWVYFLYETPKDLEVDFLDVGQGDSILIRTPAGQNILIDAGPDRQVLRKIAEVMPFLDRTIDLAILTHAHEDHLAGLVEVINRYRIDELIYNGARENSATFRAWSDSARARGIPVLITDHPQTIDLGAGAKLEILWPRGNSAARSLAAPNSGSIVSRLVFGRTRFIFMGDLEQAGEKELESGGIDLSADVLKVAHHGSDTASTEDFLEAVRPDIAVISVGSKNKFGHPSERIINRLERLGIRILRTDQRGTVSLMSDGERVTLK